MVDIILHLELSLLSNIWYHDGINTGKICLRDGTLGSQSEDELRVCRGRDLAVAVYAQKL